MSWISSFQCDECGRTKGDANHWFLAIPVAFGDDGALQTRVFSEDWLMFGPWNPSLARRPGAAHACSEECAHKLLSKHIGHKTALSPENTVVRGTQP